MADLDKVIADRIATIRIDVTETTQKDFAELVGVKQQHTISGWETGKIKPGLLACLRIIEVAKKYGKNITMEWLRPDLTD